MNKLLATIQRLVRRSGHWLLLGGSLSLCSFTAAPPTDCLEALRAAYRKLAGTPDAAQGVYHLQFTTTTRYRAPEQRTSRETATQGELYYQGSKGFFKTAELSVWQDGRYTVTALHAQRTILLTRAAPGRSATPAALFTLQDSLLRLGRVQLCRPEQVGKQTQQHVQLVYTPQQAATLSIQQLDFWLTPQQTLQQLRIQYLPSATVQHVTFRFAVQEWLPGSTKLPTDARAQVLDAQGHLLPAYAGYRLVNQLAPAQ